MHHLTVLSLVSVVASPLWGVLVSSTIFMFIITIQMQLQFLLRWKVNSSAYRSLFYMQILHLPLYLMIPLIDVYTGCLENPSFFPSSFHSLAFSFPFSLHLYVSATADLCLHPDSKWQQWRLYSMGYSYLAFGSGNTSGMNVRCNLNDLLPSLVPKLPHSGIQVGRAWYFFHVSKGGKGVERP